MKFLFLIFILLFSFLVGVNAQENCQFYVYKTTYTYKNFFMANEFEKNIAEIGLRRDFIRLSDTSFADYYKLILRVSKAGRNYYLNATQYMEATSCNTFRENIIFDTFLSYKEIQIDAADSGLIASHNFAYIVRDDSIFISINDRYYLRYLLKGGIAKGFHPEFINHMRDPFESTFIRKENQLFFGDTINTLVFEESNSNRKETIWYNAANMVPIKKKVIYPDTNLAGDAFYDTIELIAIYQF